MSENEASAARLRLIAVTELLLILPAALFMTALFVRNLQPAPYEPAETARRVVEWYAAHVHLGLHLFLMALPLAALVLGGLTVLAGWGGASGFPQAARATWRVVRAHLAVLLIAAATLTAGGILAIVALHVMVS